MRFFFFSSRRRHTRLQGDWSSDVCSSDLVCQKVAEENQRPNLHVSLVVPTLYRKTTMADEILAKLKAYFPDRCAKTQIGRASCREGRQIPLAGGGLADAERRCGKSRARVV